MLKKVLTLRELRRAAAEARQFSTPLSHLTIATSGPRDAKLQVEARRISEANVAAGYFSVSLWSWEEIWEALVSRPALLKRIAEHYWPIKTHISRSSAKLSVSRLPLSHDTGVFRGREEALSILDAAWADPRVNVFTVVAMGGAGKSTLVSRWVVSLLSQPKRGGIKNYFDWSFYNQGTRPENVGIPAPISGDIFIDEALIFFGDEPMAASKASRRIKGERLAELVASHRTLLVLDGLEALQVPTANRAETELNDYGLQTLLGNLALQNAGLVVITTRESVLDLQRWRLSTCPELRLAGLSDAAGASVLTDLGVIGSQGELERASSEVKGHALTLNLMGRYLAMAFCEHPDIKRKDCFNFHIADETIQNGHAFRVIATYERWMRSHGKLVELAILQLLALFDRPATPDCLNALLSSRDLSLTEPLRGISQQAWHLATKWLEQFHLADLRQPVIPNIVGFDQAVAAESATAEAEGRVYQFPPPKSFFKDNLTLVNSDAVDTHPLIREYFQSAVSETSRIEGHNLLFTHLCQQTPHWPDNKDGLQVLYQAVKHGTRANRALDSFEVCRKRIWRDDDFFGVKRLGDIDSDLELMWCFFKTPWTEVLPSLTIDAKIVILHVAGFSLRATGRMFDALAPLKQAEQGYIETDGWVGAADTAANLNAVLLLLGNGSGALHYAKRAIQWADQGKNRASRWLRRAECAYTASQLGDLEQAADQFRDAQALQASLDRRPEWFSSSTYLYSQFLFEKMDYAKQDEKPNFLSELSAILETCSKLRTTSVRDEAFLHLMLSGLNLRICIIRNSDNNSSAALMHADASLESLRLSHRTDLLPLGFLARAEVSLFHKQWGAFDRDIEAAGQMADARNMPFYAVTSKLLRLQALYSRIRGGESRCPSLRTESLSQIDALKRLTETLALKRNSLTAISEKLLQEIS